MGRYFGGDKGAARATSQYDAKYEEEVKDANTRLQASMGHQDILTAGTKRLNTTGDDLTSMKEMPPYVTQPKEVTLTKEEISSKVWAT